MGIRYLGSKRASGAYQAIISKMPPHDTYIETHLGSGSIMLLKPPALRSIGVDINRKVINRFHNENIELVNKDAIEFLKEFNFRSAGRTLIYSDPPYLHSTRALTERYEYEYSEEDHQKLLAVLKDVPASVIVSGYPSELYDNQLRGWNTYQFQVMTRGGVRTEQIWFNFAEDVPFWCTYAGKNYTDRQRIKRKAMSWADRFKKLPPNERTAILAALLQSQGLPEEVNL